MTACQASCRQALHSFTCSCAWCPNIDQGRPGVCATVAVYINDTALPEGDRPDAQQTTACSSVVA
jgi:hypothetical protein